MNIEKIETKNRWPNIHAVGVTHLIHIVTNRGVAYTFNRNAKGRTWFGGCMTNSRPGMKVIAAAEAA